MTLGTAASSSTRNVSVLESFGARQFRKINGRAHPQRHRNQQREKRSDDSAVDERQCAELVGDRIPEFRGEKAKIRTSRAPGNCAATAARPGNRDDNDRQREKQSNEIGHLIAAETARLAIARRVGSDCGDEVAIERMLFNQRDLLLFLSDYRLRQRRVAESFAVLLAGRQHPGEEIGDAPSSWPGP